MQETPRDQFKDLDDADPNRNLDLGNFIVFHKVDVCAILVYWLVCVFNSRIT